MKKKILFIGLGRMGYHMASYISKKNNFLLSVYNRTPAKAEQWLAENKGKIYEQNEIFDYIVICVGNDNDVKGIFTKNSPFLANINSGTIVIDHTTTSANLSREISKELKKYSVFYLDAPVSGGEIGAINGTLSCMVGGSKEKYLKAIETISCYSKNIVYIGRCGSGQIAKMANQICIAGTLAGLSEAITLLQKEGIDTNSVYDAIKGGAAQSWQMDNRFKTMINDEFDFGFAIYHMIKDLKYSLEHIKEQNWDPVIAKTVLCYYEQLARGGYSSQDTSVLIKHYHK